MTATAITSLGEDTAVPIFGIVSSRAINKAYEMELVAFGLDNGPSPLKPLGCTPPSPRVNKLERTFEALAAAIPTDEADRRRAPRLSPTWRPAPGRCELRDSVGLPSTLDSLLLAQ